MHRYDAGPDRPGWGPIDPTFRSSLANLKASAGGQWGAQVTEMDGAVNAFQTTVSGVDGDSLLASLPAVVRDLERIDAAWTSLEGQIDRDCG